MLLNLTYSERFWAKVNKIDEGCWLWTGARSRSGYGVVSELAHRVSYAMTRGEVPRGMDLDHLCNVRHCVNPAHLEPVSKGENTRRAWVRSPSGTRQPTGRKRGAHCGRGHEFTPENTYLRVNAGHVGERQCRACARERMRVVQGTSPERFKIVWPGVLA